MAQHIPLAPDYIEKVLRRLDQPEYQPYIDKILQENTCYCVECFECPLFPGRGYSCHRSVISHLLPLIDYKCTDAKELDEYNMPDIIRSCRRYLMTQCLEDELMKHQTKTENIIT